LWTASLFHARRLSCYRRGYSRSRRSGGAQSDIFIYRIDLNDLRNLLTLFRGPNPTYIPAFLAEDNYFGAEFGTPLLSFQPLRSRQLLADWHASVSATHQNSALNARNFFNVGPLLSSLITSYNLGAGGPLVSSRASLLLDFGQIFNSHGQRKPASATGIGEDAAVGRRTDERHHLEFAEGISGAGFRTCRRQLAAAQHQRSAQHCDRRRPGSPRT